MQLSVKDVAKLLNVPEKKIYGWIRDGSIPAHCTNEQCRFNRAEILEWAISRRMALAPEIVPEPPGEGPFPSLADALRTGGVFRQLEGGDKPSVLRAVVGAMRLPEEVDREFLLQVLLAREDLGSTGVGGGIAIPHVRNPIVLHLAGPTISLSFLKHPIDFGAVDGKPVDILFTMASPTVRAHLHLLSRLGFVLRDPAFKDALEKRLPDDRLMQELARAEEALPAARNPR